jgi:hypothetical protein
MKAMADPGSGLVQSDANTRFGKIDSCDQPCRAGSDNIDCFLSVVHFSSLYAIGFL